MNKIEAQHVEMWIEKWKALVPIKGPIHTFIANNTLSGYESHLFWEALQKSGDDRGIKPQSWPRRQIKQAFANGKINQKHLHEQIRAELEFYKTAQEVFAEKNQISWSEQLVKQNVYDLTPESYLFLTKEKLPDGFLSPIQVATTRDQTSLTTTDEMWLSFISAYLDHGISYWAMAQRENGLFNCFSFWFPEVLQKLGFIKPYSGLSSFEKLEWIGNLLNKISERDEVDPNEVLRHHIFKFTGWASLFHFFESLPQKGYDYISQATFLDYVLVKLCLGVEERVLPGISPPLFNNNLQNRFDIFNLKRKCPDFCIAYDLASSKNQQKLMDSLMHFTSFKRFKLIQKAWEKTHYETMFKKLSEHAKVTSKSQANIPTFQVVTCIDDREESFRRKMEIISSDIETLSYPGFFNLDLGFKKFENPHFDSYCPLGNEPKLFVQSKYSNPRNQFWANVYKRFASVWHRISRSAGLSIFVHSLTGMFSILILVFRIFAPYVSFLLNKKVNNFIANRSESVLDFSFQSKQWLNVQDDVHLKTAELLKIIGLDSRMAKYVVIMGHGSSTKNNPLSSAYECGACSAKKGGVNARVLSWLLNDLNFRKQLEKHNIFIPATTKFVGAYHDTTSDDVDYYDLYEIKNQSHFILFQKHVKKALALNAKERLIKFPGIKPPKNSAKAQLQVQLRAESYYEPRPEYGHASNSLCVVGPRIYTRDCFLDRRAFLVSYEPKNDLNGDLFVKLVNSITPVVSGINLEYYFSALDPLNYGAGSKLPFNIVALKGVMNGSRSDYRTGLAKQMVEIHEPIRMMYIFYAPLKFIERIKTECPRFTLMARNHWHFVSFFNPDSQEFMQIDF